MRLNNSHTIVVIFLFVTVFSMSGVLRAADIYVPADQPTIQAAVDVAVAGDTIIIADGTYTGSGNVNVDPGGKDLIIRSENGASLCIIDCEDSARAFYIHSGETSACRIEGLRIINSYDSFYGGGIYCRNYSDPVIADCEFIDCVSGQYGAGIYITFHCNAQVTGCLFQNNSAVYGGGLNIVSTSNVTVTSCMFTGNNDAQDA
ncbi:right-handed parallel beta-helix repeat-containing protein, partial [bacterium]|nr:right-handed parallel beta-helix repeat-containing protein [bacterium]